MGIRNILWGKSPKGVIVQGVNLSWRVKVLGVNVLGVKGRG